MTRMSGEVKSGITTVGAAGSRHHVGCGERLDDSLHWCMNVKR